MTPDHAAAAALAERLVSPKHGAAMQNLARAYLDLLERMHRAAQRGESAIGEVDVLVRQMGGG